MGCRCAEMTKLLKDINILKIVTVKSVLFNLNINLSETEQESLKTDSWSAAESSLIKSDIECKLPNMAEKIVKAHDDLIIEIDNAIQEMEEVYVQLEEEDNEYHAH